MITSPYNFVPLSKKVVQPFWAKQVSHDIPFKDAQSGVLNLKITAKSPIYVRNGVSKSKEGTDEYNAFNNIGNRYFIPGSSIKGMLRSVMEIMSYGRMKNKVNDHRYSVRDFQNNDIYPKTDLSNRVECGWLYKKGDEYYIDICGKPGRISHRNLDCLCNGQKISEYYKRAENVLNDKAKSAKSKCAKFDFVKEGHRFSKDFEDMGRVVYKIDQHEGKEGTIVMSGQPGIRKEPNGGKASGKHLEFVFFESRVKGELIGENVIENFLFAYYDHDRTQQSEDWKWRKSKLDTGERIPVFFQKDTDGTIKDIGLSLLYKITYKNSILDLVNHTQKQAESHDLAETIFGFAEEEDALKGRVHFGHAFAENNPKPTEEKKEVLAGPKASYYPNYVEQNPNQNGEVKEYLTYMDDSASIRGWKRYPVHSGTVKENPPPLINGKRNEKVAAKFTPLPAETSFVFDIHYHNLRKEELGALISGISFHNTKGLYHSIGTAKPLGYGKILLEITNLEEDYKKEILKAFELYMDYELGNSTPLWFQSVQIQELLAMAKPGNEDSKLKYMGLTDFVTAKGKKRTDPRYALLKYSIISGNKVNISPLATEEELKGAIDSYQQEKDSFEKSQNIETLKVALVEETKYRLKQAFSEKKNELIEGLRTKKDETQKVEEREKKKQEKIERKEKAQSGLPVEWHDTMGFNNLSKRIPKWQKRLPGKTISEKFKSDLFNLLRDIISLELSNSKTKRNWKGSFEENRNWIKICEWLGEARAKALYEELKPS